MNEQIPNTSNPEDEKIAQKLNRVAEQTYANAHFAAELEEKLRNARPAKTGWFATTFRQVSPSLRWAALMILLAVALSWSIRTLIPAPQLGGATTPNGFVCPVTQPNGNLPPGTQQSETAGVSDPNLFGNGELWTVLWPGGKVYMLSNNQRTDGSFETNWPWYQGVDGQLTIDGRRLDAQAEPLHAELFEPFNNFQGSTLIFPTVGCWEITGRAGDASLTFVTEVLFDATAATPTMITTPDIVAQGTMTPGVENGGYDWRDTKLYLAPQLPDSPTEANVYLLQPEQPATVEQARALAEQFGIQGEVYVSRGLYPTISGYFITDGKQSLSVNSNLYFTYTADMAKAYGYLGAITHPNAESIINDFLQSPGLDFTHRIESLGLYGGYSVEPLSPEGFPMRYEYYSSRPMRIALDENGQVLQLEANLMSYELASAQTYPIISAEEAFQRLMDDFAAAGKIESFFSSSTSRIREWKYTYPRNQRITIYGLSSSIPALDSTRPPFTQIDGYTLTGNTNGLEALEPNTFVEAIGQFTTENGIETFQVESWGPSPFPQDGLFGTIRHENGQALFLTEQQEELVLQPDVPADLPLPFENAFVLGVRKGNVYEWTLIDDRMTAGGGGGGGGLGFYKLNLSGTPVPFPSPTAESNSYPGITEYVVQEADTCGSIAANFGISIQSIIDHNELSAQCLIFVGQKLFIPGQQEGNPFVGRRFEKQRGTLAINVYKQSDGSLRNEFTFTTKDENGSLLYLLLEDVSYEAMLPYHNRPLDVWGIINYVNEGGTPVISVERYEAPFPGLAFQIMQGTQEFVEIEGGPATLFITDDGKSYVQMSPNGMYVSSFFIGNSGDQVYAEALLVPDETYGGYPTMRVFNMGLAVNPKNGEPSTVIIQSDQPYIIDEIAELPEESSSLPSLIIENVELIYYVTNQHWQVDHLDGGPQYIQPIWRFHGHYENGDEFEMLIQALKQEYLLPEWAPYIKGG